MGRIERILRKMTKGTKKEYSTAEINRYTQRKMEERGVTWDLQLVLNGDDLQILATLGKFKKRGHLKPEVRRRVIAAARAALIDPLPGAKRRS